MHPALCDKNLNMQTKRRVSRKAVDWAKRYPLWLCEGAERAALLATVAVVAWGGWMAGRHPHRLGWGVVMCIAGEWGIQDKVHTQRGRYRAWRRGEQRHQFRRRCL